MDALLPSTMLLCRLSVELDEGGEDPVVEIFANTHPPTAAAAFCAAHHLGDAAQYLEIWDPYFTL